MPLQKTPVTIPIASGIDEGSDPRLSLTMTSLQNGAYIKTGALDKRFGTAKVGTYTVNAIGDTVPPPAANSLIGGESAFVRQGGAKLHTYDVTSNNWSYDGLTSPLTIQRDAVLTSTNTMVQSDVAFANGYYLYGYLSVNIISNIYTLYLVLQDQNGATIEQAATNNPVYTTSGGTQPTFKLCALSGNFYVAILDNTGTTLKRFNTSSLTFDLSVSGGTLVAVNNVFNGGVPLQPFDFVALDTQLCLAGYQSQSGSTGTTVLYFYNTALALTSTKTAVNSITNPYSYCVAPHFDGTNSCYLLYRGFNNQTGSGGSYFLHYNGSSITPGETSIASGFGTQNSQPGNITGAVYPLAAVPGGATRNCAFIQDFVAAGGTSFTNSFLVGRLTTTSVATTYFLQGVSTAGFTDLLNQFLGSRAWVTGNVAYVGIRQSGYNTSTGTALNTQSAFFIARIGVEQSSISTYPLQIVGTSAPRQLAFAGGGGEGSLGLCQASPTLYTIVAWEGSTNTLLRMRVNFAVNQISRSLNGIVYAGTGSPSYFDGTTNAESGYFTYPWGVVASVTGSGNLSGNYSYVVTYEWTSARGVIERSAPSSPVEITTSSGQVSLTVPCLHLTNKAGLYNNGQNQVQIVVYRTISNGSIYYRTQATGISTFAGATIIMTDNMSDAALQAQPQIYTTGNELDNVNPPSATFVHTIAQEIWLLGTDDDTIWFSPGAVGNQAPVWNEGFTIQPFAGGRCVGMSDMDGTRYIFKTDTIWAISGAVPNEQGLNGTLSQPQRVCINDGCIEPRSIVATQEGIYFQSRRGICRLNRSTNVEFIGNNVVGELAGYQITSAALDVANSQVLFSCLSTTDNQSGKVLAYNWRVPTSANPSSAESPQGWSVNSYRASNSGVPTNYGPTAMTIYNGRMAYADARGQCEREDPTTYLDEGNLWVTMSWVAPESHGLGISGYQLIYRVGLLQRADTPHGFTLSIAYDYLPSYEQVLVYTDSQVTAMTLEEIQVHVARKCRSLRLAYADAPPTVGAVGTGKGPSVTGITLELGSKGTLNRLLPAAQR